MGQYERYFDCVRSLDACEALMTSASGQSRRFCDVGVLSG